MWTAVCLEILTTTLYTVLNTTQQLTVQFLLTNPQDNRHDVIKQNDKPDIDISDEPRAPRRCQDGWWMVADLPPPLSQVLEFCSKLLDPYNVGLLPEYIPQLTEMRHNWKEFRILSGKTGKRVCLVIGEDWGHWQINVFEHFSDDTFNQVTLRG
jgi:hypothetical protein